MRRTSPCSLHLDLYGLGLRSLELRLSGIGLKVWGFRVLGGVQGSGFRDLGRVAYTWTIKYHPPIQFQSLKQIDKTADGVDTQGSYGTSKS